MNKKEEKKDSFLRKLKEINFNIEKEEDVIKHNNIIKEELDNINESYNRCLEILNRSAKGSQVTQRYNDLYTQNRREYYSQIDELDSQSEKSNKEINKYLTERDSLKDAYRKEEEKETSN